MKRSNFDFLIVGTNFISDNFTDAVRRLDGVGISAVLSRRKETGEAFASLSEMGTMSEYEQVPHSEAFPAFDGSFILYALFPVEMISMGSSHFSPLPSKHGRTRNPGLP